RQRAAERVEVEAWRDARRAPVAVGAAEHDERRSESVDGHVGRSDDEVVLAELSAELPGPDVRAAGEHGREASRRALVRALERRAARADQPADELHVSAERIVRVGRGDDREPRERERRRRVARGLVVREVKLEAAVETIRESVRDLDVADIALLARHEAPEFAEVELTQAERDIADRRVLDH